MEIKNLRNLTFVVNTAILIMVLGLMFFFHIINAKILVYFSIPTIFVYLIGYVLISKSYLYAYVCLVYLWLTLYMSVATICLGYGFGFHLYGMSMIPIIFFTEYMGHSMNSDKVKAIPISLVIVVSYLVSTLIPTFRGPIYEVNTGFDLVFWVTNSVIVLSFLIFYSHILIKGMIYSEDKLKKIALEDNLTGLYNRHFMLNELEKVSGNDEGYFLAMADIDNFKKINDIYGHNAGDSVLKGVAEVLKKNFEAEQVCRWGGEEFLILGYDRNKAAEMMEKFRSDIRKKVFEFDGNKIFVTLTIGIGYRTEAEKIDKWVQVADDRLYKGKNNGKNQVVDKD